MAFIRKRADDQLSLVFWWQAKSWIKALGTTDEKEAEQRQPRTIAIAIAWLLALS